MSQLRDGLLFGMGNPLLDMQSTVDGAFLKKYDLEPNNAILAEEKHKALFEELKERKDVEYVPGGATQNTMRVCQWVLNRPNVTTFMGSVGDDEFGKILEDKSRAAGVNVQYQKTKGEKSGTCAVLVNDQNRSLVADLSAANLFKIDHLKANEKFMRDAQFYYISGFFLTVSPESIQHVAQHAHDSGKTFTMNLSAPFLAQFFKEPMLAALEYADIIFGNETEAATFAEVHNLGTKDVVEIAKKLAAWPKKNENKPRLAVITQGSEDVICAMANGSVNKYPVTKLKKEQLVDTNGAGDAFVGGFLAQYIRGEPEVECVKCGNYAALTIIQRSGCSMPATCDY